jgi:DNA polymerase I-like protein with 3'-5' exonuclease and polymerase domains
MPQTAMANGFVPIRPHRRVLYDRQLSTPTQAINFGIQGAAASVQMRALRLIYDKLTDKPELDTQLIGSIHDEILLESPDDERAKVAGELLQHCMRTAFIEIFPESAEMGADKLAELRGATHGLIRLKPGFPG